MEQAGALRLGSANLDGYGLALFRSGDGDGRRAAWLYYGRSTGHGHRDRLNFGLYCRGMDVLPDLGYPEYADMKWPNRAGWTNNTASHNTVVVDAKAQEQDWTVQEKGTYAGEAVGFGVPYDGAPDGRYKGSGFSYLYGVCRTQRPEPGFRVDWNLADTWSTRIGTEAVHVRFHALSRVDEAALAWGDPPRNKPGNPRRLRYLLLRRRAVRRPGAHGTGRGLPSFGGGTRLDRHGHDPDPGPGCGRQPAVRRASGRFLRYTERRRGPRRGRQSPRAAVHDRLGVGQDPHTPRQETARSPVPSGLSSAQEDGMSQDSTMGTAREAARRIAAGEWSSTDAVRACLERIEERNGEINAVVTLDRDGALRRAAEADAARIRGGPLPPLHGVPFTVKDNIATARLRTTASHPPLKDYVPDADATVVARLKAAGAILLGKTNLPELAMDFQTDSPIFGRSNNPHDPSRTTGGSSGGAAAAVASGMSFFDVGNDLLGSVRIPAHFCGTVGFVPGMGLVPRTGIVPRQSMGESVRQLPRFGFLTRSVGDAALLASVTAGLDGHDMTAVPVDAQGLREAARAPEGAAPGVSGLRLLAARDAGGVPVSRAVGAAYDAFLAKLSSSGARIREVPAGAFDFRLASLTFLRLFYPMIGAGMPPLVRFLAGRLGGMGFLDQDLGRYFKAEDARRSLMEAWDVLLSDADALLCPVTPTPAFPHVKPTRRNGPMPVYTGGIDVDGRTVDYGTATVGFTLPFSTTGSPVVVLPIGASPEGLPVGIQIVGRRWDDARLLRTAVILEAARQRPAP